jgi:L-aminopeptidase/D-esterase-like protein/ribosomal protein S18 acetylase RimI-like enzyme
MGRRNDLTDVPGFRVGSAQDPAACTGCTVVLCPEEGAVGGVDQRGGAPGTRETDPLRPLHLVERCHAILLTGGSAFGLDAAGGIVSYLERHGIGYPTPGGVVPIVPAAVIYDLGIGHPGVRPDAAMGEAACRDAEKAEAMRQGNAGAGCGATVGKIHGLEGAMKGGLGSASAEPLPGLLVGALAVVNPFGDVIDSAGCGIIAGARRPGTPPEVPSFVDTVAALRERGPQPLAFTAPPANTVLAVVAVNAKLDKQEANLLARMAGAGITRTVRPAQTMVDGDTVFALAAGKLACDINLLGAVAADLVAMAVMRGVLSAESLAGLPAAGQLQGKARGLRVRSGGVSDTEAATRILEDLPEWFVPESVDEIAADMKRYETLIAEIEGRVVGVLVHGPSAWYPEPDLVKIHWLAVARSHRGRGIGQALTRSLEDLIRQRGGGVIELMTVADTDTYPPYEDTRAFYRAIGYEEFFTDANLQERFKAEMLHFRKRVEGI